MCLPFSHSTEHGRDLFDAGAVDQMISAALDCPFADVKGKAGKDKLRAVFDALDTSGDGIVDSEELEDLGRMGHSATWLNALQTYQERTGLSGLDFDTFCKVLGYKHMLTDEAEEDRNISLSEAIAPGATYHTKAAFLFEKMNHWAGDGDVTTFDPDDHTLSLHDLAYVLSQYGIPPGEAKQAMRK
eukprot:COSAG02_NODE_7423_length_3023_cov_2.153215_3_plen_186_part_00